MKNFRQMATKLFTIPLLSSLLAFFASRSFAQVLSAYSYQVGGWCFLYYWNNNHFTFASASAQAACGSGSLAVGVTYAMMQAFMPKLNNGWVWLTAQRNDSIPQTPASSYIQGWNWQYQLPSGSYSTVPIVMSNVPWSSGQPLFTQTGFNQDALVITPSGVFPVNSVGATDPQGATPGILCQFAPVSWNFLPSGTGRFANTTVIIAQTTCIQPACILQCHQNLLCVSLAYNPTNSTCELYAVSPADPRFSSLAIADPTYNWYIRDGMTY